MDEARRNALRVGCDRAVKLEIHGAKVSSDAVLFPYRDLDEAVQLTDSSAAELFDCRTSSNVQHGMTLSAGEPVDESRDQGTGPSSHG